MGLLVVSALIAVGFAAAASADRLPEINPLLGCRRNPAVVANCFAVHGRIQVYNGAFNVRIWPVGSKRLLGVLPQEAEIVPDNVRRHLSFEKTIYGDFLVCPFTNDKPGEMRMVCIQEAEHLVIEDYSRARLSGVPVTTVEPKRETVQ